MRQIFRIILSAVVISCISTSCSVVVLRPNPSGKIPPGQMKKATGSKSAQPYAPGQQKKRK